MKHFSNPDPEVQGKEGVESLVGLALGNGGGQIGRLEIGMNKLGEIIRVIVTALTNGLNSIFHII